jgi:hypothetical protein
VEIFEIDHSFLSLEKGIIIMPLLLERVYGLTVSVVLLQMPLKAFTGMLHF